MLSRQRYTNPFTQGVFNHTNITGMFGYKPIKHAPIDINIKCNDAKDDTIKAPLTKLSIDTLHNIHIDKEPSDISYINSSNIKPLQGIESLLSNIKTTLSRWKYESYNTNAIGQYGRRIIQATRDILNILSGNNISGLLSNVLTEYEMVNITPFKGIFDGFKRYFDDDKNVKHRG